MPRYLEVDYLEEHVRRKRELLNQCLLTVPQLNVKDHETSINVENLKTLPNTSEEPDLKSIIGDEKCLEEEFKSLNIYANNIKLPEVFNSIRPKKAFCMLDIIPSSNPDSPIPDSLDNLVLSDLEREVEEYVVESIIESEEDLTLQKIEGNENPYLLEEVLSVTEDSATLKKEFSAFFLCKKLRPARLSDPFDTTYNEQLAILKNDRYFGTATDEKCKENEAKMTDDVVERISVEMEDENLLEEALVMPGTAEYVNDDDDVLEERSKLEKIEILPPTEKEYSGIASEVEISDVLAEKLERERERLIGSENDRKDFELLTDEVEMSKEECLDFESPLSTVISSGKEEQLSHNEVLKTIENQEVSPVDQSFKRLLSPSLMMNCEKEAKEKDRYLDDTLALSLTVPEVTEQKAIPTISLLNSSRLEKQDIHCHSDVGLGWDPLQLSSDHIQNSKKTLLKEKEFCKRKQEHAEDPLVSDLKTIPVEGVNDFELVEDDFRIPLKNEDKNKKINERKSFTLPQSEKEAKMGFISKLEKTELSVAKIDGEQKRKEFSQSLKVAMDSEALSKTPLKSGRPSNQTWKRESNTESALDGFVMLRTGEMCAQKKPDSKPLVAMIPPRQAVKAAKIKPSVFKDEHKSEEQVKQIIEGFIVNTPQKKSDDKPNTQPVASNQTRREVVSIPLNHNFVNILKRLERDSRPLMVFLKGKAVISHDYQFFTLQPDVTRFLLRQQEQKNQNNAADDEDMDIMKGLVCLHALILAAEAITNYGIQAAIGVLKSIREKYENLIHGILEPVRKQLAKELYKLDTTSKLHPKLEKITEMIQNILIKSDRKILILVRKYYDCCYTSLQASLRCMKNVVVMKYPKEAAEEGVVNNMISQANVIIAELSAELQYCPWNRFSFVFEFENKEDSEWYNVCFEENKNLQGFFAFDCFLEGDAPNQDPYPDNRAATSSKQSLDSRKSLQCFSQHILIGTSKVTENKQLLSELECKFNIVLIQRDYSPLHKKQDELKFLSQPDIVVDERTCIILYTGDQDDARTSDDLIRSVQYKCSKCYIIVWDSKALQSCSFSHTSSEILCKAITQSCKKGEDQVAFKVLHAFSVQQTAQHILEICNNARDTSDVWTAGEWGKRFWLTEEMSMHEKFLLSFPFFTSFSAQLVLTALSLKTLMRATLSEMRLALKWIPERIVKAFHVCINNDVLEESNQIFFPVASEENINKESSIRISQVGEPYSKLYETKNAQRSNKFELPASDMKPQWRETNDLHSNKEQEIYRMNPGNNSYSEAHETNYQAALLPQNSSEYRISGHVKKNSSLDNQSSDINSQCSKVNSRQLNKRGQDFNASVFYDDDIHTNPNTNCHLPQKVSSLSLQESSRFGKNYNDEYGRYSNANKPGSIGTQQQFSRYAKEGLRDDRNCNRDYTTQHSDILVQDTVCDTEDMYCTSTDSVNARYARSFTREPRNRGEVREVMYSNRMAEPPQGNEYKWNPNTNDRSEIVNPSLRNTYPNNSFPAWEISTNSHNQQGYMAHSNGRRRNQTQPFRKNGKEKIRYAPITTSMIEQERTSTTIETEITPSKRFTPFGVPSTVRLTPSKRRRLSYQKDPGAKDGQTRLTFL